MINGALVDTVNIPLKVTLYLPITIPSLAAYMALETIEERREYIKAQEGLQDDERFSQRLNKSPFGFLAFLGNMLRETVDCQWVIELANTTKRRPLTVSPHILV